MTNSKVKIDPVTLAVLKGRFEQIADEMDVTLFRSAFNPIIAEAHDASHGLYDANSGDTLVQGSSGLPIFVGVMSFAVKAVIKKLEDLNQKPQEGDVWIFNDPYDGGTHLSDFRLVKPIFYDGKVFCYLASVGHWHDVGGNVPGNYNPVATECFQEGILIPPVKLYETGIFKKDIADILLANSRLPNSLYGDLNGQINALDLGENRLHSLLNEYGYSLSLNALDALKQRAETMMRTQISNLPNGKYSAEDWLDNDGISDVPLKIALDLTIDNDQMVLDFSRSSKACSGPVNISYSTTVAACYVALKHLFEDVPANAGVLAPIVFKIEKDSILSVKAPKPVGGYTETILRLIDVIFLAMAEISPLKSMACAYGTINALSLSGYRSDDSRWVMFSFFGGGHGAYYGGDGLNHGNAPISTATIPPLEILEAAYPIKFVRWALRPDSGGAGEFRGGLGAIYEIELLEKDATVSLFGERGKFPPRGISGGLAALKNTFTYQGHNGYSELPFISKGVGVKLKYGERLQLETPGGGGFGSPFKRPLDLVLSDLEKGYISVQTAINVYGVRMDNDGNIDRKKTITSRLELEKTLNEKS